MYFANLSEKYLLFLIFSIFLLHLFFDFLSPGQDISEKQQDTTFEDSKDIHSNVLVNMHMFTCWKLKACNSYLNSFFPNTFMSLMHSSISFVVNGWLAMA